MLVSKVNNEDKTWIGDRGALQKFLIILKLDGVGPVDNRPSTAEAPQIGKIHPCL